MSPSISLDTESDIRYRSRAMWTALLAKSAAGLGVVGVILVIVAWHFWPDGERLPFDITFSIGMLGVNAAWLLGVIAIVREVWFCRLVNLRWPVMTWAVVAIAVAEGVFW